jgi:FkbM family methyltransferase
MSSTLKALLSRFPILYRGGRSLYRLVKPARHAPSDSEQAIAGLFGRRPDVWFVQVGSNDGRRGDPINALIRRHRGWRGMFIEPLSEPFRRLRTNYGSDSRFVFVQAAVADICGELPFYFVSEDARHAFGDDLPFWYDQLGSFDREHIVKHLDGRLEPFIRTRAVPCAPLTDILSRHGVPRIDLLHVDVEGFDARVLQQFDFERYRPHAILYEHQHLSADDARGALALLHARGYSTHPLERDTLALDPGEFAAVRLDDILAH